VARGSAEDPLDDAELHVKFHALATPVVGRERAMRLQAQVAALADGGPVAGLLADLLRAP
jgi:hypothetical protein